MSQNFLARIQQEELPPPPPSQRPQTPPLPNFNIIPDCYTVRFYDGRIIRIPEASALRLRKIVFTDKVSDFIDRSSEYFERTMLRYLQGYQDALNIQSEQDLSLFICEAKYWGVQLRPIEIITIHRKSQFDDLLALIHAWFGDNTKTKDGKTVFKSNNKTKLFTKFYGNVMVYCKTIGEADIPDQMLKLLMDGNYTDLMLMNFEKGNLVYDICALLKALITGSQNTSSIDISINFSLDFGKGDPLDAITGAVKNISNSLIGR